MLHPVIFILALLSSTPAHSVNKEAATVPPATASTPMTSVSTALGGNGRVLFEDDEVKGNSTGTRKSGIDTYLAPSWYRLHVEPKTYADAMLACQNEDASLAVPTSKHVEELLVSILRRSNWLLAYVGVNDIEEEGRMVTVLGEQWSKVGYTRWEHGEPNDDHGAEDCVIFTKHALLNDWNCTSALAYFCEKSALAYRIEKNLPKALPLSTFD